MRIGVFAYNFEHKKSQEGLLNLFLHGYQPAAIFAADRVNLNFYQSNLRIAPRALHYIHPSDIARRLGIPYFVLPHNSESCAEKIQEMNLDLGIILGARILKQHTIDAFKIGILNRKRSGAPGRLN